jgi:hypothetical protein
MRTAAQIRRAAMAVRVLSATRVATAEMPSMQTPVVRATMALSVVRAEDWVAPVDLAMPTQVAAVVPATLASRERLAPAVSEE